MADVPASSATSIALVTFSMETARYDILFSIGTTSFAPILLGIFEGVPMLATDAYARLIACGLVLTLAACGGSATARRDDASADPHSTSSATFDREDVVDMIQTRRVAIMACYERALRTTPTLVGRIVVQMTVEESGSVEGVHVVDSSMPNGETVSACVLAVFQGFRFRDGPASGSVTYAFPFVFEPQP